MRRVLITVAKAVALGELTSSLYDSFTILGDVKPYLEYELKGLHTMAAAVLNDMYEAEELTLSEMLDEQIKLIEEIDRRVARELDKISKDIAQLSKVLADKF